jgi:hypothetical protein
MKRIDSRALSLGPPLKTRKCIWREGGGAEISTREFSYQLTEERHGYSLKIIGGGGGGGRDLNAGVQFSFDRWGTWIVTVFWG